MARLLLLLVVAATSVVHAAPKGRHGADPPRSRHGCTVAFLVAVLLLVSRVSEICLCRSVRRCALQELRLT